MSLDFDVAGQMRNRSQCQRWERDVSNSTTHFEIQHFHRVAASFALHDAVDTVVSELAYILS